MRLLLAAGGAVAPRLRDWLLTELGGYGVEVAQTVTTAGDCLSAAGRGRADVTLVHHSLDADGSVDALVGQLAGRAGGGAGGASRPVVVLAPLVGIGAAGGWLQRAGRAGASGLLVEGESPLGAVRALARAEAAGLRGQTGMAGTETGTATEPETGATGASRAGRVRRVVVARAKGGVGATFVAANLAALWRAGGQAEPLLVDLAIPFGGLPAAIGADGDPGRSAAALLPALAGLDRAAVESQLRTGAGGLRVLGLPDAAVDVARIGPGQITALLGALGEVYPDAVIVVDAPLYPRPLLDAAVDDGATVAGAVVLVSTAEPPALAATRRLARQLRDDLNLRPGHDLHLVINQTDRGAAAHESLGPESDWPPLALLPRNVPLLADLVQRGAPVPEGAGPLRSRLEELSRTLWERLTG
jgi:MinD-like ATPase involved in chromosome partitioning or flagellar assembly